MDDTKDKLPLLTDWQAIETLFQLAAQEGREGQLWQLLLTEDEREQLLTRANIFHALMEGKLSQRKICDALGVGIATITRGSHALKQEDDASKAWLLHLLNQTAQ